MVIQMGGLRICTYDDIGDESSMTTAIDVSFLSRLTEQAENSGSLGKPWAITMAGEPWAFATDGYMLVTVRTASTLPNVMEQEPKGVNIEPVVFPLRDGISVKLADLKAWAETPNWPDPNAKPVRASCDDCRGRGYITGDCHSCGRSEDEDCGSCDGQGYTMEAPPVWPEKRRHGVIMGKVVDRERVARCLDHFTDETVTVSSKDDNRLSMLQIRTPDWIVGVMPIREDVVPPEWPVFDLNNQQAIAG